MSKVPPAWVENLRRGMAGTLPGSGSHRRLAPRPRAPMDRPFREEESSPAGVLALLYPDLQDDQPVLILTTRPSTVPAHPGQVCLPGGRLQRGETLVAAALREAEEEIGVAPTQLEVLGALTPVFIPVSGFRLSPFVAVSSYVPMLRADPREVEDILHVPLRSLTLAEALGRRVERRSGVDVDIPFFQLPGRELWGATAMIVAELLDLHCATG